MADELTDGAALVRQYDGIFKANHKAIIQQAPRGSGDPNRLLRIAYNTVTRDVKLLRCTPQSIMGGVFEALKLGLAIGGPMQEAWLIPFRNGKTGKFEATFIVGYQGYRNIIDRARAVIDLHPRAVYQHDDFDFEFGVHPRIRHKPHWMIGHPDAGPLVAVYAVARLRGGGVQLEVLPRAEVDAHRARSRAKDSGPWVNDYDAMALKTAVRKISKYVPKSSELLSRALELDDQADRGVAQDFDTGALILPPDQLEAGTPTSKMEALKKHLRGGDAPPAEAEASDDDLDDSATVEADKAAGVYTGVED